MPENYAPQGANGPTFTVPEYTDEADGVKAFKQFADSLIDDLGGINADADRDGQVIQYDTTTRSGHWVSGPVMKVVQDLPDETDPAYAEGDIVFVLGDVPKAGGGSPAAISAENGADVERGKVIDGKTYDIYTFKDDTRTDMTLTVEEPGGLADVLVVGGGAGGSTNSASAGGGGGAGGMLVVEGAYLAAGSQTIIVGAGGTTQNNTFNSLPGSASRCGPYYAVGGGAAGTRDTTLNYDAASGGSGGGGAGSDQSAQAGGLGTSGQGNDGGSGVFNGAGGGGGGAGAAGSDAVGNVGGAGGAGLANSFTGSSVTYAGGGGGGGNGSTAGAGGSGGGGAGATGGNFGTAGTPNTGGGGGGSEFSNFPIGSGGDGGSGIVIVRVEV